jgi:ectoine hydroxylase-related dioxygenase (phytanoyl-CoA dioxygenase family)
VPLHQDLSIPVQERLAAPELVGWSEKNGTVFVQPPDEVLQQLVALRLHIDDCALGDGPLKMVPGSHRFGRLGNETALALRDRHGERVAEVARGAALLMRPLILHASSKSTGASRRRVLHFVFGPPALPYGLRWRYAR